MRNKSIVAAFDFDGTLTYFDTLVPFLCFSTGSWPTSYKLTKELPRIASYVLGQSSRQSTKESILTSFFKNKELNTLKETGLKFAETKLNQLIKPEGLERVNWHLKQGHRCILVSANLDLYLKPWAKLIGFQDSITSVCQVSENGMLTGKLEGLNCWGKEKTRRLEQLLGDRKNYTLYAYGDSKGDADLLSFADYAFYRSF